jgi:hypothetical protein
VTFPLIDPAVVRPDIEAVALLEMTRTIDGDTGLELGIFTENTRPTAVLVEDLIDLASNAVLGRLPAAVDPGLYPAIRDQIAVRAAIWVEFSFFREQVNEAGPAASLIRVLNDDAAILAERAHGGPAIH